jgi:HAD superfamily hydrolase (TIGR01509 family)
MLKKHIKAVLFDVDGTLFDRVLAQKEVCALIVKQLPRIFGDLKPERVLEAYLESDRVSTERFDAGAPSEALRDLRNSLFLQLLGLKEDLAAAISEIYVRDYPKVKTPVDGAIPVVKKLSRKFKVGIVSNGLADVQYTKLETIGLRHLFSCIVLSEEFGIRKPDSKIFHHAVSLLHLQPAECLYVGDSYINDVIGAKTAGMQACWFNPESLKSQDENIKPEFIVNELEELLVLLEKYE